MSNIYEQIESIREINRSHKLVIFVGAGVSKNSGVCSWWELVKDIANKIDYNDICEKCELKFQPTTEGDEKCSSCCLGDSFCECPYRFNYSDTEFLKIPQYFYEMQGEETYIQFLQRTFNKSYTPNEIDELIVELKPEHIITTNYDHLIEDVKSAIVSDYTVISQDKDLLEKYGKKYIIKMHGDINDIKNVVLKEDDYLNYSKSHELIEMFIKSLLFDKTFYLLAIH